MNDNTCQTEKAKRDYLLLRRALDENDQQAYAELMSLYRDSIFFAGWDRTGAASVGAGIHHPGGDWKKISLPQSVTTVTNGTMANKFFSVAWRTNPNNEHLDGTLAMARSSMPDSAGSQFYFCLGPQPFLDSNYTVFGQTIEGLDVIHNLRAGDVIESVEIENVVE